MNRSTRGSRELNYSRAAIFALRIFTGCVLFTAFAQAQAPQSLPPELQGRQSPARPPIASEAAPTDVAVPEWMVWRAFYESLRFYQQQSPRLVAELLAEGAGLTAAEGAAVTSAGQQFLDGLARIDDEARKAIAARFQPRDRRFSPAEVAGSRSRGGAATPPPPSVADTATLIPDRTPDGRSVVETLAAEGIVTEIRDRQTAEFRAHWEALARTIGLAKLVALERLITTRVSPNVHVATQAAPVPERRLPVRSDAETTPR